MTLGRDRPTANQKTHLSFLIRDPEENAHRAGKIKKKIQLTSESLLLIECTLYCNYIHLMSDNKRAQIKLQDV